MPKILILAANPRKDLNLDREIRDLKGAIERSEQREAFTVVDELAVRVEDLQPLLLEHKPNIVHFCGHGEGEKGLVLDSGEGKARLVRSEALSELFRLVSAIKPIKCVLLNACYSETQAEAIVTHINYVIGMNQTICDDAAIAFATGFYLALGHDCGIEMAYGFGCNAIQLSITGSSIVRSSVSDTERKAVVDETVEHTVIPEHLRPILKKRASLATIPHPEPPQEVQAAIRLDIDKALESDKIEPYRQEVRKYLQENREQGYLGENGLQDYQGTLLEILRDELDIPVEKADEILKEEFAPTLQARQAYRNRLNALIQFYPFSPAIAKELKQFQSQRKLTDAEVEAISRPILEKAEWEQRKQRFTFDVITVDKQGKEINKVRQSAEFIAVDLGNGVSLEMVAIPGGTYLMGSPTGQGDDDERPQHPVTVPSFLMGKYPVTQIQWQAVVALPQVEISLDPDPSRFKGDNRPVEQVSWHEAVEFCQRLSRWTGHPYRFPSEAEWEYACRAWTTTPFHFGETITAELANYRANYTYAEEPEGSYRKETTPAGQFPPNTFGLYDMYGNVWEWCADHWHGSYQGAPKDEKPWITAGNAEKRLIRGGSWIDAPASCRSARRNFISPADRRTIVGFRVSRAVSPGFF
jgi:formylglycine-generating enzyme required for sulfatase activity